MISKDYLKKAVESKISRLFHHLHHHQTVRVVYVVTKIVVTLYLIKTHKEKDMERARKVIEAQGYVPVNIFSAA